MAENETANAIAQKIAPRLAQGEKILWCGKTEKASTTAERNEKPIDFALLAIFPVAAIMILVPFITQQSAGVSIIMGGVLFGAVIGEIVIVSLIRMLGGRRESYAITDRRFLMLTESGVLVRSVDLEKLYNFRHSQSGRNIGYVYAQVARSTEVNTKSRYICIRGVPQPAVVSGILSGAAANALRNRPAPSVVGVKDIFKGK